MTLINRRRLTGLLVATFGLALAMPAFASAHPLGNFTINRYNGLTVSSMWIHLDRVVDMAELPTIQARQQMDVNRDSEVTNAEAAAWAESTCQAATSDLQLTSSGADQLIAPRAVGLTFAPGQAGLETLRIVCSYLSDTLLTTGARDITFRDNSYPSRQGWREIVVIPDGVAVNGAEEFALGTSDRLRVYPTNAGGAIRAQSTTAFSAEPVPGQAAGAIPIVADAVPFGSPADEIVGRSAAPAVVPGGVADLPAQLTEAIQAGDLSLPAVLLALVVAAAIGAFHAATPGHGKTLMAAYLVGSRGTVRHALGLGLTVTLAHTIGVFALGMIVIAAGAALPSERLLPILGLASGVVVTLLGVVFLWQRISAARHGRQDDHAHAHAHEQGLEHSHGPIRHTHLPADEGPLRRRNLLALGLVGGLVPSASAILILVGSIAAGRPAFGLILTVAFGAGMASVLVGVGVLLVRARSLVERLPSRSLGRALTYAPLVTALVFVVVGVAITVQSGTQLQ